MRKLVAALARRFGLSWVDVMDWLQSADAGNNLDAIEQRVRSGQWDRIIANLDDAALRIAAEGQRDYITAANAESDWLDGKVPGALVRFEPDESAVVRRARANKLELVRGFREEANQVTRQIVQRAMIEGAQGGINPRQVARDFRDSIGLTAYQEGIVANYRRALESKDYSRALGYELSDGNADRTVRTAMRDDRALTPAQVDSMTEKYRRNMLRMRAETIARTEGARNAEDGSSDAMRQAIERGNVDAEDLVVTWHAGPRTRDARDDHQALDGVSVKFGETFRLADGTRMSGPGDPRGGAKHNANCRCTKSTSYSPSALSRTETEAGPQAEPQQPPMVPPEPPQPSKNPRRQAAARLAAAASVERRREIYSAARSNLPRELHAAWDKEGHKFLREEASRIRGVKDRVNAASTMSQAFAEKYGAEGLYGAEGDRAYLASQIDAEYAVSWANEEERKYFAAQQDEKFRNGEVDEFGELTDYGRSLIEPVPAPQNPDDDDPPF